MRVEFVYAVPERQWRHEATLPEGTSLGRALAETGLETLWPEADIASCEVRVWGQAVPEATRLRDGDRVEFLRPLVADPKDARRRRAARAG
jgi:hypothetical protein